MGEQILLQCDQLRHDERWILDASRAAEMLEAKKVPASSKNGVSVSLTTLSSDIKASQVNSRRVPTVWSTLRSCLRGLAPHISMSLDTQSPACCSSHPERPDESIPIILDLRGKASFKARHISNSVHLPLKELAPGLADGDLFGDPDAVFSVWNGIQTLFNGPGASKRLGDIKRSQRAVVVVCYDGDASRLGTSTLRHLGVEAFSVKGGFQALDEAMSK